MIAYYTFCLYNERSQQCNGKAQLYVFKCRTDDGKLSIFLKLKFNFFIELSQMNSFDSLEIYIENIDRCFK